MPVMGGIEAAKAINKKMNDGEIPEALIVALSAEQLKPEDEEYYRKDVGFDSYATKPISRSDFLNLLKKYSII